MSVLVEATAVCACGRRKMFTLDLLQLSYHEAGTDWDSYGDGTAGLKASDLSHHYPVPDGWEHKAGYGGGYVRCPECAARP